MCTIVVTAKTSLTYFYVDCFEPPPGNKGSKKLTEFRPFRMHLSNYLMSRPSMSRKQTAES